MTKTAAIVIQDAQKPSNPLFEVVCADKPDLSLMLQVLDGWYQASPLALFSSCGQYAESGYTALGYAVMGFERNQAQEWVLAIVLLIACGPLKFHRGGEDTALRSKSVDFYQRYINCVVDDVIPSGFYPYYKAQDNLPYTDQLLLNKLIMECAYLKNVESSLFSPLTSLVSHKLEFKRELLLSYYENAFLTKAMPRLSQEEFVRSVKMTNPIVIAEWCVVSAFLLNAPHLEYVARRSLDAMKQLFESSSDLQKLKWSMLIENAISKDEQLKHLELEYIAEWKHDYLNRLPEEESKELVSIGQVISNAVMRYHPDLPALINIVHQYIVDDKRAVLIKSLNAELIDITIFEWIIKEFAKECDSGDLTRCEELLVVIAILYLPGVESDCPNGHPLTTGFNKKGRAYLIQICTSIILETGDIFKIIRKLKSDDGDKLRFIIKHNMIPHAFSRTNHETCFSLSPRLTCKDPIPVSDLSTLFTAINPEHLDIDAFVEVLHKHLQKKSTVLKALCNMYDVDEETALYIVLKQLKVSERESERTTILIVMTALLYLCGAYLSCRDKDGQDSPFSPEIIFFLQRCVDKIIFLSPRYEIYSRSLANQTQVKINEITSYCLSDDIDDSEINKVVSSIKSSAHLKRDILNKYSLRDISRWYVACVQFQKSMKAGSRAKKSLEILHNHFITASKSERTGFAQHVLENFSFNSSVVEGLKKDPFIAKLIYFDTACHEADRVAEELLASEHVLDEVKKKKKANKKKKIIHEQVVHEQVVQEQVVEERAQPSSPELHSEAASTEEAEVVIEDEKDERTIFNNVEFDRRLTGLVEMKLSAEKLDNFFELLVLMRHLFSFDSDLERRVEDFIAQALHEHILDESPKIIVEDYLFDAASFLHQPRYYINQLIKDFFLSLDSALTPGSKSSCQVKSRKTCNLLPSLMLPDPVQCASIVSLITPFVLSIRKKVAQSKLFLMGSCVSRLLYNEISEPMAILDGKRDIDISVTVSIEEGAWSEFYLNLVKDMSCDVPQARMLSNRHHSGQSGANHFISLTYEILGTMVDITVYSSPELRLRSRRVDSFKSAVYDLDSKKFDIARNHFSLTLRKLRAFDRDAFTAPETYCYVLRESAKMAYCHEVSFSDEEKLYLDHFMNAHENAGLVKKSVGLYFVKYTREVDSLCFKWLMENKLLRFILPFYEKLNTDRVADICETVMQSLPGNEKTSFNWLPVVYITLLLYLNDHPYKDIGGDLDCFSREVKLKISQISYALHHDYDKTSPIEKFVIDRIKLLKAPSLSLFTPKSKQVRGGNAVRLPLQNNPRIVLSP